MGPDNRTVARDSLLFWLTILVPLGLIAIGVIANLNPELASIAFGIPVVDSSTSAFVRAAGIRDIFAGLAILALLLKGSRRATGIVFALAIVIPVCDGLLVFHHAGFVSPIFLHWISAIYMAVISYFLLHSADR